MIYYDRKISDVLSDGDSVEIENTHTSKGLVWFVVRHTANADACESCCFGRWENCFHLCGYNSFFCCQKVLPNDLLETVDGRFFLVIEKDNQLSSIPV